MYILGSRMGPDLRECDLSGKPAGCGACAEGFAWGGPRRYGRRPAAAS